MRYAQLKDFIERSMRMSHIYQPVMIHTLLESGGSATEEVIARNLLSQDQSQIEYYINITRNMVGRVLRNHGVVEREGKIYKLTGFDDLTQEQIDRLKEACKEKLIRYVERRGSMIWQHRRLSSGYISGTVKYEVLKAAKFHCELCGISAHERALEVDHIVPRNKGGSDELTNLQALCYQCNAMKRDRDNTNFSAVRESFENKYEKCLFCAPPKDRLIDENELAFAIRDGFPVTPLHTLVIPKRHVSELFDLGTSEMKACHDLLLRMKSDIQAGDMSVAGFNVGVNVGEAAGQTIFHCHIHLIPRRRGDVANPRGGVRHVIPEKGYY